MLPFRAPDRFSSIETQQATSETESPGREHTQQENKTQLFQGPTGSIRTKILLAIILLIIAYPVTGFER